MSTAATAAAGDNNDDMSLGSFALLGKNSFTDACSCWRWCPSMDLLAAASSDGMDVWIHRLSWQRLWAVNVGVASNTDRSNGHRVTAIEWRPDGKVIALGHSNGTISLYDVERCVKLHVIQSQRSSPTAVVSMQWTSGDTSIQKPAKRALLTTNRVSIDLPPLPSDCKTSFSMSSLQSLNDVNSANVICDHGSRDDGVETDDIFELDSLNDHEKNRTTLPQVDLLAANSTASMGILVVTEADGRIHLYARGLLLVAVIEAPDYKFATGKENQVLCASSLSPDFYTLTTILQRSSVESSIIRDPELMVSWVDMQWLAKDWDQFRELSLHTGLLIQTVQYVDSVVRAMEESWEDILLQFDTKLKAFAQNLPVSTSLENELLQLLTCGTSTPDLQHLLVSDLTEQGVKRLRAAVEQSYSTIERLASEQLQSAAQTLVSLTTDLLGISRWRARYASTGISESSAMSALATAGSFSLKVEELLCVISASQSAFGAFFHWLYIAVLRLSDEEVPANLASKPVDTLAVAEFLRHGLTNVQRHYRRNTPMPGYIKDKSENSEASFASDRVGQYFHEVDLTFPWSSSNGNEYLSSNMFDWSTSAAFNSSNLFMFRRQPEKSLKQLSNILRETINAALPTPRTISSPYNSKEPSVLTLPIRNGATAGDSLRSPCVDFCYHVSSENDNVQVYGYLSALGETSNDGVWVLRWPSLHPESALCLLAISSSGTHPRNCIENMEEDNNTLIAHHMWYGVHKLAVVASGELMLLHLPNDDDQYVTDSDVIRFHSVPATHLDPLTRETLSLSGRRNGMKLVKKSRDLGFGNVCGIAVSGPRRVASVLVGNGSGVLIFDMEDNEDDEDEDDEHEENGNEYEDKEIAEMKNNNNAVDHIDDIQVNDDMMLESASEDDNMDFE